MYIPPISRIITYSDKKKDKTFNILISINVTKHMTITSNL